MLSKKTQKTKYGNAKTIVDGHKFDSKAEAEYYKQHKIAVKSGQVKMQESFLLQEKVSKHGKTYRKIEYKPDFSFYNDKGDLLHVVDVKGVQTDVFKLKAKMFVKKYDTKLYVAKMDKRTKLFLETLF